jgi:hypothetical protein
LNSSFSYSYFTKIQQVWRFFHLFVRFTVQAFPTAPTPGPNSSYFSSAF